MADPPAHPEAEADGPSTGTPRWVKVFGVIALVVVVLFVVLLLTGGHGPRRHTLSGALGGHEAPYSVTQYGGQQS